jgi:thymidylate synthase (FAD)
LGVARGQVQVGAPAIMAVTTLRLLQAEAPAFFSDFEIYTAEDRREAARISFHKV